MNDTEATRTRTSVILLAAGASSRLGGGDGGRPRKPFLVLESWTILEHACAAFDRVPAVVEIVIVGHAQDLARLERMAQGSPAMRRVRAIVAGGELRADSVRAGVQAIDGASDLVLLHDAARPLVEPSTIERAITVAAARGAALVAIPVHDTVKTSSDGERAETTLDRSVLWSAQTPQVFQVERFRKLLAQARAENFRPTDDSALHERYFGPVPIVLGSPQNLKITTSEDLVLAASILRARAEARA